LTMFSPLEVSNAAKVPMHMQVVTSSKQSARSATPGNASRVVTESSVASLRKKVTIIDVSDPSDDDDVQAEAGKALTTAVVSMSRPTRSPTRMHPEIAVIDLSDVYNDEDEDSDDDIPYDLMPTLKSSGIITQVPFWKPAPRHVIGAANPSKARAEKVIPAVPKKQAKSNISEPMHRPGPQPAALPTGVSRGNGSLLDPAQQQQVSFAEQQYPTAMREGPTKLGTSLLPNPEALDTQPPLPIVPDLQCVEHDTQALQHLMSSSAGAIIAAQSATASTLPADDNVEGLPASGMTSAGKLKHITSSRAENNEDDLPRLSESQSDILVSPRVAPMEVRDVDERSTSRQDKADAFSFPAIRSTQIPAADFDELTSQLYVRVSPPPQAKESLLGPPLFESFASSKAQYAQTVAKKSNQQYRHHKIQYIYDLLVRSIMHAQRRRDNYRDHNTRLRRQSRMGVVVR
jgi:hypothetical protein